MDNIYHLHIMRKEIRYLRHPWNLILIILLGFSVYLNTLTNTFIWDDDALVKNNIYIRSPSYLSNIFTQDIGKGSGRTFYHYRPLQALTYMLDYSLWKLNAVGYHLTNVLLHIGVALLLYWFITLVSDNLIAFFASLFFVIHPIHTEAVSYISGRADSLAALFLLLCFILYIKYLNTKNIWLFLGILSSCVLALLSRENTLILPVLLGLYHYIYRKKSSTIHILPLVGITFLYIIVRIISVQFLPPHTSTTTTLFQRIPGFFIAFASYLKLLILPYPLHMEYGNKIFAFTDIRVIIGAILFLCLYVYVMRTKSKNTLLFFSLSWFLITLIPQSNLYPVGAYMAEHWLYLPSIGFFLVIAWLLRALSQIKNLPMLPHVILIILIFFYGTLTIWQNRYWGNPLHFYKYTAQHAPSSYRVHNNLGKTYSALNQKEKAITSYRRAIELEPEYAESYNNLGLIYYHIGDSQTAVEFFKKAIDVNPNSVSAYTNLGFVYSELGKRNEAMALYEKAIEVNPDYAQGYSGLGILHAMSGNLEKAITLFEKAIAANPYLARTHYNLGKAYDAGSDHRRAIASYQKAIQLNPEFVDAYNNLAILYFERKQYAQAIECFDQAKKLGFRNPALAEALKPYRKE
ncbi:MAG: tetratricopeptide repeat protein [Candidatus Omnitrophota bacterium]|nr:MAG: tetratricopeptide repeat protein [Candidatus Omnitrophota bacterium]